MLKKTENIVIIGKNAVGKSTFLQIASGFLEPTEGNVLLDGKDIYKEKSGTNMQIGFVTQQNPLIEDLSVYDNIVFWASSHKIDINTIFDDSSIIRFLELDKTFKKKAKHLSGGMQKRLNIACSLIHDPSILILDEPFSGIDITAKNEIIMYLNYLRQTGKSILYTCHDLNEIFSLSDSIYIMSNGNLRFGCYTAEFKERYGNDTNVAFTKINEMISS